MSVFGLKNITELKIWFIHSGGLSKQLKTVMELEAFLIPFIYNTPQTKVPWDCGNSIRKPDLQISLRFRQGTCQSFLIYTHRGGNSTGGPSACHCAGSGCAMCMVGACIGHPSWWVCNRRYSCFKWATMLSLMSGVEIWSRTLPLSKERVKSPENISYIIRATTGMTCWRNPSFQPSHHTVHFCSLARTPCQRRFPAGEFPQTPKPHSQLSAVWHTQHQHLLRQKSSSPVGVSPCERSQQRRTVLWFLWVST